MCGSSNPTAASAAELRSDGRATAAGHVLLRHQDRAGGIATATRTCKPECRQHAGGPRAEDPRDAELLREAGGVHRPRAAEGDERVVARVHAALDRREAQRAQHLRVRDAHDAPRRFLDVEPERFGKAQRRLLRGAAVEPDVAGQRRVRAQVAEHAGSRR